MWVDLIFIAVLLAVAVVDYLTKSIYDMMLIVGALICYPLLLFFKSGFVSGFVSDSSAVAGTVSGAVSGAVPAAVPLSSAALGILYGVLWGLASYGAIFLIAKWIYKDEVFGMGDVLFNGFICGYLGLIPGILTSFLTFFVAMLLVVADWIRSGNFRGDLEIPLAPAMAISAVISLYWHVPMIDLILRI